MNYHILKPDVRAFCDAYELSYLAGSVLTYAELNNEQLANVLSPSIEEPVDENLLLQNIRTRIVQAQNNAEKVFVFGDYDADGICATTLAVRFFRRLGLETGFYIPNRLKEGYGLNVSTVVAAEAKGYRLIVAVDNGVSAFDALQKANDLGVDVIIIDHHILTEGYPYPCLLHPSLLSESYQQLCGAGTVLQLIRSFKMDDDVDWILAMGATIGDMMPLFYANRTIVQKGLKALNEKGYLPFSALSNKKQLDETAVSFDIVPALNTPGRLADRANANNLVNYLLLDDAMMILNTAAKVSALNKERQKLVSDAAALHPQEHHTLPNYLVYYSEAYHEGIIGLLANRFMHQYHRPVLVFTRNENEYRASGRSSAGYDIYKQLYRYSELFSAFGGHAQACGFSVPLTGYNALLEALREEEATAEIGVEAEDAILIEPEDLTVKAVEELLSLKPFGQGFPLPLFYLKKLPYQSMTPLKNNWKKTSTVIGNTTIETLCFQPSLSIAASENAWHDILVNVSMNAYKGAKKVNLIIKGILD